MGYTKETVLERFKDIHGEKYDYSKFEYMGAKTKSIIICKLHGEFFQTPQLHLNGSGCPECGKLIGRSRKNVNTFIEEARKVHGDTYDYSKVVYKGADVDVEIICKDHGSFYQRANQHLRGSGCLKCSYIDRGLKRRLKSEDIQQDIDKVLKELNYTVKSYPTNTEDKIYVTCSNHGDFLTNYRQLVYLGNKCPKCAKSHSSLETLIRDELTSKGIKVIENDRKVLSGREIDLLIPEFNVGVEIDGIIWHSTKFNKQPNYHLQKTEDSYNKGIQLIHIFEDEVINKKDVVISLILSKCGKFNQRVYARQCLVREITNKEAKEFCDKNHLKGGTNSSINLGLFYKGELLSVMTFSGLRVVLGSRPKDGSFELVRLCSKVYTQVIGGASKLLKYFERTYRPKEIISYSDKRYSNGDVYSSLGFNYKSTSVPNYYYVKSGSKRLHRFKYTKKKLIEQGFDPTKSEKTIMEERGFYRIYDCGSDLYVRNSNTSV